MNRHAKPSRRTQAERSEEMRARLARAAFEIIAERGISSLRTAAVVERIGVSQGALLHHFANKEELTLAAIDHVLEQEEKRSAQAFSHIAGDRDTVIAALIQDFRLFFMNHCFWAALDTTMDAGRDPALKTRITKMVGGHRLPVYNGWIDALRHAGFDAAEAEDIVAMTAALISGMAIRSLWDDNRDRIESGLKIWSTIVQERWESSQAKGKK